MAPWSPSLVAVGNRQTRQWRATCPGLKFPSSPSLLPYSCSRLPASVFHLLNIHDSPSCPPHNFPPPRVWRCLARRASRPPEFCVGWDKKVSKSISPSPPSDHHRLEGRGKIPISGSCSPRTQGQVDHQSQASAAPSQPPGNWATLVGLYITSLLPFLPFSSPHFRIGLGCGRDSGPGLATSLPSSFSGFSSSPGPLSSVAAGTYRRACVDTSTNSSPSSPPLSPAFTTTRMTTHSHKITHAKIRSFIPRLEWPHLSRSVCQPVWGGGRAARPGRTASPPSVLHEAARRLTHCRRNSSSP